MNRRDGEKLSESEILLIPLQDEYPSSHILALAVPEAEVAQVQIAGR